jgi:hypothetical protein
MGSYLYTDLALTLRRFLLTEVGNRYSHCIANLRTIFFYSKSSGNKPNFKLCRAGRRGDASVHATWLAWLQTWASNQRLCRYPDKKGDLKIP